MNEEAEKRIAAQLAKAMAMLCVRNSRLEDLHAGVVPVTKTGDWSDVIILDADGNRIPWRDVSRIDDDEMRLLMRDVVNRLYTFQLHAGNTALQAEIEKWMSIAGKWDEPQIDNRMLGRGRTAE
jgi:hypothetical protein